MATSPCDIPWQRQLHAFLVDIYDGYTSEEWARHRRLQTIDLVAVLPIALVIWGLFKAVTPATTTWTTRPAPPSAVALGASLMYALVTVFVLYEHMLVYPGPTAESVEIIGVTARFGRWVFLTRQALTAQAVHAVCSCLADWGVCPTFTVPTHANAVLVAALNFFVCVQFFTLVYPDPMFQAGCDIWAQRRIPFCLLLSWMHIPCGVFAVIDLLVVKDRRLLLASTPPLLALLCYVNVYASCYVVFVHINHAATGHWPYYFMNSLGPRTWVTFTIGQLLVIDVFLLAMWALMTFVPNPWGGDSSSSPWLP